MDSKIKKIKLAIEVDGYYAAWHELTHRFVYDFTNDISLSDHNGEPYTRESVMEAIALADSGDVEAWDIGIFEGYKIGDEYVTNFKEWRDHDRIYDLLFTRQADDFMQCMKIMKEERLTNWPLRVALERLIRKTRYVKLEVSDHYYYKSDYLEIFHNGDGVELVFKADNNNIHLNIEMDVIDSYTIKYKKAWIRNQKGTEIEVMNNNDSWFYGKPVYVLQHFVKGERIMDEFINVMRQLWNIN